MVRVFLHGELGSLDEIGLGLAVTMVLVVDGILILAVWRTEASQRAKILWSVAIFALHFLAWAGYAIARANGKLEPRAPPPT